MQTEINPSNITTGTLASRLGSDIIGKVGYFYKQGTAGGAVEPNNVRRLVQVTGFYRDRGVMVYTFSAAEGPAAGFTRVEGIKFAAYTDQADALAVLHTRQKAYTQLMLAYVGTNDAEEKAYINAAARALKTV